MQAGFVHRDLRWDNTACSFRQRRYYLLDLELCGRPGRPRFTLESWPDDIMQAGRAYTEASDILILGNMLRTLGVKKRVMNSCSTCSLRLVAKLCQQQRTC